MTTECADYRSVLDVIWERMKAIEHGVIVVDDPEFEIKKLLARFAEIVAQSEIMHEAKKYMPKLIEVSE